MSDGDGTKNLLHKFEGLGKALHIEPQLQWTPSRQPMFDTEWLDRGMSEVSFFTNPMSFKSEGRNFGDAGKRWGLHTNQISRTGLCAKGQKFYLERVVMYPTFEDVRGSREGYLNEVERFRAGASYSILFGSTPKWSGPLSDLLSCCAPPAAPEKGDFDPSEAPGLEYRRGIDVRVDGRPCVIDAHEDFRVCVRGLVVRGEVGIRCYLVGTLLSAILQ